MGEPNRSNNPMEEFLAIYKSEQAAMLGRQQQFANQLDHLTQLTQTLQTQMASLKIIDRSQDCSDSATAGNNQESPIRTNNRGGHTPRERTEPGGFVPRFTT